MQLIANYKTPPGVKINQIKILLIMKLTTCFMLFACLEVGAKGVAQKVTLNENKSSLEKVLKKIEYQTGYTFLYESQVLEKASLVTLHVTQAPIDQVLSLCFRGQPLTYKIFDRTVVIKEKVAQYALKKEQTFIITPLANIVAGKVTNSKGEPLVGVSVTVKGTSTGTSTDGKGNYSIDVPGNGTLVFSYVGFTTREMPVNGRSLVDVVLEESASALDQVVVVGYGTQKKKDLTGSVGLVDSKDIGDLSVTRADQALMGKIAGVQVKAVSGQPGSMLQVRVRGIGSISAGTDPLYVVDGFPTDNIQTLNPSDIESMDILKDASATAIYGSRGSNGVIIITTKRGKSGKAVINFETSYGVQEVHRIPKVLNAKQLSQYALDGMRNKNLDKGKDVSGDPSKWTYPMPSAPLAVLNGTNSTDNQMVKQLLRKAPMSQYQLSASGGNDKVKYALSGEYLNQEGVVLNSNFQRYSVRANIDAKLSNRLTLKINLNPSYTESNITDESQSSSYGGYISASPINRAQLWPTMYPARDDKGDYFMFSSADASPEWNPLAWVKNIINKQKGISFLGNINAEYKINNDLALNVNIGGTLRSTKGMRFEPSLFALGNSGDGKPNVANGRDGSSMDVNWLSEYTLNYSKSFSKHNISGLVGFTSQKDHLETNFLSSNLFPNNLVPTLSAVGGLLTGGSADISEWSLTSYLARIIYNYASKYYITTSLRTDGSSRFGSERKYGIFPSVALAWRMSDENFLKDVSFLNELKLRASFGETGNNNIGNYAQFATINYLRYVLGESAVTGFAPAQLSNPFLTWEKQQSFNLGMDVSFFNRRLSFTVDYFKSHNNDLLLSVNIPSITGFSNTLKNIGEVQNEGLEISASSVNIAGRDFQWSTNFNISTYRNKVIRLGPNGDPIFTAAGMVSGASITEVGQPIGMFFGFLTDGIYMNQAEVDKGPIFGAGTAAASHPGDLKYKDVNGDGIIDNSDQAIMGNPYPDFYYGMTNRVSYKWLSLSATLQGTQGSQILNMSGIGQLNYRGARVSQLISQWNYWKSESEPGDGKTARPNDSPTGNNRAMSQKYLDNGSFLRITNITLAYMLPQQITKSLKITSFQVYANATNAFTFTKNTTSFNPDVSNSGNPLTPGIDFNDYPLPVTLTIGLNIGF